MGFSSCNHPFQELLKMKNEITTKSNFSPSLEPNDENCSVRYNLKKRVSWVSAAAITLCKNFFKMKNEITTKSNFSPSLEPNDENCSLRYNLKTLFVCLFVFSFYFVSTDIIPAHLHHSFSM